MAYNLQPLITILQQILDPQQTWWILGYKKKPRLESLLEKAASLQQILEKSSLTETERVETQIRDAAHKVEDVIESYMVNRRLSSPRSVRFGFSKLNLRQVIQEFDSAVEKVVKTMSSGASSSHDVKQETQEVEPLELVERKKIAVSLKKDLVGVDEDLMQLKDRLTNMQRKLQIIPIIGMGGIGKSALALSLYDDPLIVEHFDYRGWAAISQVYNMRSILLSLLRNPNGKLSDELIGLEECELKDILYKRLFGRRYLIVLDDIWTIKAWDEIRRYLPNNNNGSRIVITTRESGVASDANWSMQHHVQLLDDSKSWDMLRQIVFGKEDGPQELREIGERIASDCSGLPLAIHVIGGMLSKVERSRDAWDHISRDVKAALGESNEHFSNILSLSYNHLPIHLKPCFLYMGSFPEDFEIKVSRLVPLWIAEGFVKSNGDRSLEEEAKDYLKALVERNLLLVPRKKSNGKPMSYAIHDLLRGLCIGKANEEKFMLVKNSPDVRFSNERRVCVHSEMEDVCASPQLMSLTRSFICTEKKNILLPMLPVLRLLRVLDVLEMKFDEFPREILQLLNLRYLAFSCYSGIPNGISRLWKLQTLIYNGECSLTSEIWEMSELRHLKCNVELKLEEGYEIKLVHWELQSIKLILITLAMIRNGFFEAIPNIVKLGIGYVDPPSIDVDLSHLHKLETLLCCSELDEDCSRFLSKLRLPCNLRKLTLFGCVIYGSFLTSLCALPSLEALKIWECVFESKEASEDEEEWEATEGDVFHSLQLLHLHDLNVVRWRADETNFPRLRQLLVYGCFKLEKIPSAIGDIPTLQLIEIDDRNDSIVASAQEIQRVQHEEYDNYDLKLTIDVEALWSCKKLRMISATSDEISAALEKFRRSKQSS